MTYLDDKNPEPRVWVLQVYGFGLSSALNFAASFCSNDVNSIPHVLHTRCFKFRPFVCPEKSHPENHIINQQTIQLVEFDML